MAGFVTKLDKNAARNLPMLMAADSSQKQKKGDGGGDEEAPEAKGDGKKKMSKKGKDLKDEMDALVDDIDAVLEENAEEFVKNYVQRGGQ